MTLIGISVPLASHDVERTTDLQFAKRSEQAGVHSVWALDRLVWHNNESLMSLAAMSGVTTTVKLGTCVLLAPLRQPALLAKQVASLDSLSNGRAILGLGVGSRVDDFAAMDTPLERRGARAEEVISLLEKAWSGEPFKYEGEFFNYDVGPIGPRPVNGTIPIWFGGGAEAVLRRTARVGDGYIASSSGGPERFRRNWSKIQEYCGEAGRDPAAITHGSLVFACCADSRAEAEEVAMKHLNTYNAGTRTDLSPYLLGTPDDCLEKAHAYVEAGAEMLVINSFTANLKYLDKLLERVVPELQR